MQRSAKTRTPTRCFRDNVGERSAGLAAEVVSSRATRGVARGDELYKVKMEPSAWWEKKRTS